MNIVRFDIEIKKRWFSFRSGNMRNYAQTSLATSEGGTYEDALQSATASFNGLPTRVKSIYNESDIFGHGSIRGVQYFLLAKTLANSRSITLEVLILTPNSQISLSAQNVIKDVKECMYAIDIKTRAIRENYVYLYPFAETDIHSPNLRIQANFKKRSVPKPQLVRNVIVFVAFFCSAIVVQFVSEVYKEAAKEILIGSSVFLVTELIIYLIESPNNVVVDDLTAPLADPVEPFSEDNEDDLESPNV